MNTGMGIVLLVVFAIGAASVLFWVAKKVARAYRHFFVVNEEQGATAKVRYLRVGRTSLKEKDGIELTSWEYLPKYKGAAGWFGLPCYQDVIVPKKYNYATVVYMDSPVKQYIYDVMANWKDSSKTSREEGVFKTALGILIIPVLLAAFGVSPLIIMAVMAAIFAVLYLWIGPSGMKTKRWIVEGTRNMTADDIRQVGRELAESREREDEMVRALRRSGVRRL